MDRAGLVNREGAMLCDILGPHGIALRNVRPPHGVPHVKAPTAAHGDMWCHLSLSVSHEFFRHLRDWGESKPTLETGPSRLG